MNNSKQTDPENWNIAKDDFKAVLSFIKYKFGSVSRFTKLAKIEDYELRKMFARFRKGMDQAKEKELSHILDKAVKLDSLEETSDEISDKDRHRMKTKINSLGGVAAFCQKNQNFKTASVFQIIDGTRKRKTKIVKDLFTKLNIK